MQSCFQSQMAHRRHQLLPVCHHPCLIVRAFCFVPREWACCISQPFASKLAGLLPTLSTVQAGWRLRYLKQYLMFYIIVGSRINSQIHEVTVDQHVAC